MISLKNKYYNLRRRVLSSIAKHNLDLSDVSIISMNCIGGIVYHDCKAKFLSPTIDLYFEPRDFLRFVNNLDFYLGQTPVVEMVDKFPVGTLHDIKIYFMHYHSVSEALDKWETRKERINKDKIFVIMVERDGFSKVDFEEFKKIAFPKLLFTKTKEYRCSESLYMSKYRRQEQLPDIIPGRYMYSKMKLIKAIKKEV